MTVFCNSIFQLISYHTIAVFFSVLMFNKVIIQIYKSSGAIIIIRIYNSKGSFNQMSACQNRVSRTPWLFSALGNLFTFRYIVKLLIGILYFHIFSCTFVHQLFKKLSMFFFYYKNNSVESSHHGIIQRKIKYYLSGISYLIDLFKPSVS